MIRVVNPTDRHDEPVYRFERERTLSSGWAHDYTDWKPAPNDIADRQRLLDAGRPVRRFVPSVNAIELTRQTDDPINPRGGRRWTSTI